MEKIKIEILATPRQFEVANYLIKQALNSLSGKDKQKIRESFGVTNGDLKKVEAFRMAIVKSFVENCGEPRDLSKPLHLYRGTE